MTCALLNLVRSVDEKYFVKPMSLCGSHPRRRSSFDIRPDLDLV